jgi:hypothetical protein
MMISGAVNNNYNSNTVVKQEFAVMKQVDGQAAHMTETTRHQSWQSTPLPDHAGSIPVLQNVFSS